MQEREILEVLREPGAHLAEGENVTFLVNSKGDKFYVDSEKVVRMANKGFIEVRGRTNDADNWYIKPEIVNALPKPRKKKKFRIPAKYTLWPTLFILGAIFIIAFLCLGGNDLACKILGQ